MGVLWHTISSDTVVCPLCKTRVPPAAGGGDALQVHYLTTCCGCDEGRVDTHQQPDLIVTYLQCQVNHLIQKPLLKSDHPLQIQLSAHCVKLECHRLQGVEMHCKCTILPAALAMTKVGWSHIKQTHHCELICIIYLQFPVNHLVPKPPPKLG